MMMRCRRFLLGASLVLGLACTAGVARAGSGYVPAPQAIGPIATEQGYPSAQWDGGCAPCGPVVYDCAPPKKHCLAGLKCKLGGMGSGLKCKLGGMKGKLGGCFHKKRACEPACYPTGGCAPCGDVYPTGQHWPSGQEIGPAPQGFAAPQGIAAPQG